MDEAQKDPWADLEQFTQKKLEGMEAEEGREFLAMVPHGWGRDKNARAAFKIARSNLARFLGKGPHRALIMDVPEGARVDQRGTIWWEDGDQEVHRVGYVEFTA